MNRRIDVRFERDPGLDRTEVVIRAPEEDAETKALLDQLTGRLTKSILAFDENGGMRTLEEDKLVIAGVNGKRVSLITDDGKWYTRRTLQSLETLLDPERFVRISRYELVNLEKVLRYDFTAAGTLRLELTGGLETWAARRCIPAIRRRLQGKEGER